MMKNYFVFTLCWMFIISLSPIYLFAGESRRTMSESFHHNIIVPKKGSLIALMDSQSTHWNIYRFKEILKVESVTFFTDEDGLALSEPILSDSFADSRSSRKLYILTDMYPEKYLKRDELYRAFDRLVDDNFIQNILCDIKTFSTENYKNGRIILHAR